ncbi:HlyC/CorC family transporter [bacterium]|nr:HlyC/CorC family transporter [bacterium]
MELIVILILVLLNGVLALTETAFIATRKTRLENNANQGNKRAADVLKLLKDPESFLSAIQIGITLVGIVAGAYGGAEISEDIMPFFASFELLTSYAFEISFVIVVIAITYLSLIIGELIPKSIALKNPERFSMALVPMMKTLLIVFRPVIQFLSFSTKIFQRIFGLRHDEIPPVTEDELRLMIKLGSQHGIIAQQESEMMTSALQFGDRSARSLMIPRPEIQWIDFQDPLEAIHRKIMESEVTKFLVCDGSLDKVVGILYVRDYFKNRESSPIVDWRALLIEPLFLSENTSALAILEKFQTQKVYIGIVVDEFGDVEGIITLHDLVQAVFGALPGEEVTERSIVQRPDGSILVDGGVAIEDLRKHIELPKTVLQKHYSTVAGLVLYHLKRIPKAGDRISLHGFVFEIVDMDKNRVDKLLVYRLRSE